MFFYILYRRPIDIVSELSVWGQIGVTEFAQHFFTFRLEVVGTEWSSHDQTGNVKYRCETFEWRGIIIRKNSHNMAIAPAMMGTFQQIHSTCILAQWSCFTCIRYYWTTNEPTLAILRHSHWPDGSKSPRVLFSSSSPCLSLKIPTVGSVVKD